jgi:membrane-associated phospholipid phosphatase
VAGALLAMGGIVDGPVARWAIALKESDPPMMAEFRQAMQQFGEAFGVTLVVIVAWCMDRSRRRPIVLTASCVFLVGAITAGLKLLPGRERPSVNDGRTAWHGPVLPGAMNPDPSFPSGHAAAAFAFAACLCRMYPNGRPAFLLLALLCGASRVVSSKHFVTDVIAGAWLGSELGRVLFTTRLLGLAAWVDRFIPAYSWYPAWNWQRDEPDAARRESEGTEIYGTVHSVG